LSGQTADLPSQYAFQRHRGEIDREQLVTQFGWDAAKPIVAVYTANWYDWPHQFGMSQFRDFLDWVEATYNAARNISSVNWLFKPHPAEEWFGGVKLSDIFGNFGHASHIAIADKSWNNAFVMRSIDALITYHGTAGIEFASLGKPVLLPDRGNYDGCGFAKVANSRAEYLELMSGEWWRDMNLNEARRRAEIFAGIWFCMPSWQGEFILGDDAEQNRLYEAIPQLLANGQGPVTREIDEIHKWWQSKKAFYHTEKMLRADQFKLSNVARH
jgi:hypothetical protein